MVDLNHLFRAQVFLREQMKTITGAAIILWLGILAFWEYVPEDQPHGWVGLGLIISMILAPRLGHRAYWSEVPQPIGVAGSVAWRIGFIWTMLIMLAEAALAGSALRTAEDFPLFLLSFTFVIAGGFMLGYLANKLLSEAQTMSGRDWFTLITSLVVIIGTAFNIYFNLFPRN